MKKIAEFVSLFLTYPLLQIFCFVLPLQHRFALLEIIESSNKRNVICGTEMRLLIRVLANPTNHAEYCDSILLMGKLSKLYQKHYIHAIISS